MAIGRSPDIAINHDIDAIRMHEVNHPDCEQTTCRCGWAGTGKTRTGA